MPRGINQYDEARLQGRLWTPDLIRSQLSLWFDAGDLSTISVATGVSSWLDKSGNGRNAIQNTSSNQPLYGTFSINGVRLPSTSASPQFLDTPTFLPPTDFDFYWVSTSDGLAQNGINTIYDHDHSAIPNGNWTIQSDNVGFGSSPNTITHYVAQFTGAWQLVGSGANGIVTNNTVLGLFRRKSTAELIRFGSVLSTATFGIMSRVTRAFRIGGCISTSGRGWRGGHAEIIYTNTTLSNTDGQKVEGYLAWKWGLQNNLIATHPFRNRPPLIGD